MRSLEKKETFCRRCGKRRRATGSCCPPRRKRPSTGPPSDRPLLSSRRPLASGRARSESACCWCLAPFGSSMDWRPLVRSRKIALEELNFDIHSVPPASKLFLAGKQGGPVPAYSGLADEPHPGNFLQMGLREGRLEEVNKFNWFSWRLCSQKWH